MSRSADRPPTSPRRRRATRLLLASLATLLGPAALAAAVLWVEPVGSGAATLAADGQVRLHTGGSDRLLATGVRGDSVRACHGELLGIGADGRLRSLTGDAVGPAVGLHSRPACLASGGVAAIGAGGRNVMLLGADLQVVTEVPLDALPDADPTPVGDALAVLSAPTQRYRHGILGDEIEAGAVTLLRQSDLSTLATLTLEAPAVIEQRRVEPFPAAGPYGMLLTRSTPSQGAGVLAVALEGGALRVVASAAPIGSGERWLNLFAAVGERAYAVRTPHSHGPLERYRLVGDRLVADRYALGVTNHRIGSRDLDLGRLLPPPAGGGAVDVLALPSFDLRHVQIVACDAHGCAVTLALALAAPLSSDLAAAWQDGQLRLYAGEADGSLQSFTLGADLWAPPAAP